jgi:hypothetical protein
MGPLRESATIETDLFEHRTVKDDLVNPCCFGEDFAAWLQTQLEPIAEFTLDASSVEDFGWFCVAKHKEGAMFVTLSYTHEGRGPGNVGGDCGLAGCEPMEILFQQTG